MALKRKLSKEEFDILDETTKALYKEKGSDYVVDLEGDDDNGELKRALDRVREENKGNKELVAKLTKQIEELDQNDARKRGDIQTLEKAWNDKFVARETELTQKIEQMNSLAKSKIVDSIISPIAAKFTTPSLVSKAIHDRVDDDFSGEEPVVRFLDGSGKPTAKNAKEFEKEILENPEYKSILIGSRASGSTRSSGKPFGSAADDNVKLAGLKTTDLLSAITAKIEAKQNS